MKVASFEAIVRALNDAEVRYIVVGGLAVNAHGYGRSTFDVDLVIQLTPRNVASAFDALERIDYRPVMPINAAQFADNALRDSWIMDKGMLVLKMWSDTHRETPLDIFVVEPFDFDAEYSSAFVQEIAPGLPSPILRLSTLLEMKRSAGRPKDLADIDELNLLYGRPSSYDREG